MKNQTGKTIKCLRTDNGLEFCSMEFNEFCKDEGIPRKDIVCYNPQKIRVAKKMNKILLERTRCMLSNLGFNRSFLG